MRADIVAAYRFGSTAHGTATSASDVDLAILPDRRLPAEQRFELQERLASNEAPRAGPRWTRESQAAIVNRV